MLNQTIDKSKLMTKVQAKVLTENDIQKAQEFKFLYNDLSEKDEIQLIKKLSTIIYNAKTGSSVDSVRAFAIFNDKQFLNIQSTNFENALMMETFDISYSRNLDRRFYKSDLFKEELSSEEYEEFVELKYQLLRFNDLLKENSMKSTLRNLIALRLVINSIAYNYNISNLDVIQFYYYDIVKKLPQILNLIQSIYAEPFAANY